MIVWFTLRQFEQLCFDLAAKSPLAAIEPIPAFPTRYPGILESCLGTPLQTFGGKDLYPTMLDKAAALFYFLTKNHPFENGNKRIALTALLVLLYRNKRWLMTTDRELYLLTIYVAASEAKDKDQIIRNIRIFMNARMCTRRQGMKFVKTSQAMPRFPKRRGRKWSGFPRRINQRINVVLRVSSNSQED